MPQNFNTEDFEKEKAKIKAMRASSLQAESQMKADKELGGRTINTSQGSITFPRSIYPDKATLAADDTIPKVNPSTSIATPSQQSAGLGSPESRGLERARSRTAVDPESGISHEKVGISPVINGSGNEYIDSNGVNQKFEINDKRLNGILRNRMAGSNRSNVSRFINKKGDGTLFTEEDRKKNLYGESGKPPVATGVSGGLGFSQGSRTQSEDPEVAAQRKNLRDIRAQGFDMLGKAKTRDQIMRAQAMIGEANKGLGMTGVEAERRNTSATPTSTRSMELNPLQKAQKAELEGKPATRRAKGISESLGSLAKRLDKYNSDLSKYDDPTKYSADDTIDAKATISSQRESARIQGLSDISAKYFNIPAGEILDAVTAGAKLDEIQSAIAGGISPISIIQAAKDKAFPDEADK